MFSFNDDLLVLFLPWLEQISDNVSVVRSRSGCVATSWRQGSHVHNFLAMVSTINSSLSAFFLLSLRKMIGGG